MFIRSPFSHRLCASNDKMFTLRGSWAISGCAPRVKMCDTYVAEYWRNGFMVSERGFKTKDGKDIPDVTDWHNIVVRRTGLAGVCEQFVKKGTPLLIVGKIQTRQYQDNSGQTRYVTEIVVEEMELLGGQKHEAAPAPEPEYQPAKDDMPF